MRDIGRERRISHHRIYFFGSAKLASLAVHFSWPTGLAILASHLNWPAWLSILAVHSSWPIWLASVAGQRRWTAKVVSQTSTPRGYGCQDGALRADAASLEQAATHQDAECAGYGAPGEPSQHREAREADWLAGAVPGVGLLRDGQPDQAGCGVVQAHERLEVLARYLDVHLTLSVARLVVVHAGGAEDRAVLALPNGR